MIPTTRPPGRGAIAAYATGSFGTGVFSTVPTVLLLYYSTEILHIPSAWAAAAVFAPKAWGIVWDPLVGAWSDRTHTRLGRRRPFLIVGTLGVAISFVGVFTAPKLPFFGAFLWVSATYFALATLYSLFAVPYIALPAEIGGTALARARMVSWRITVAMIGVLAGAGIAPLLVEAGGGGRVGYSFMSLCLAAACAIAMTAPVLMLRGRDITSVQKDKTHRTQILTQIRAALRHRKFVRLTLAYVLQLTAAGIISAAAPYLVTRAFGRSEGDIGIALLAMLSATTLTVPLWAWAGRKFGERAALVVAVVLFAAGAALLGIMARADTSWSLALIGFAVAGVPFAGMQVLPFTIIAHMIHAQGQLGTPAEGAFTGIWTASEKLGLALGPALTGVALSVVHGDIPHGLATFVIAGPAIFALLSLPLVAGLGFPLARAVTEASK